MIVLAVILLAAVTGGICIGVIIAPTVNHALRIAELLQPVIDAPNQAMHICVSAKIDDEAVALNTDVYMVTEEDIPYLALEQKGLTLYVADNILLLENGKAFKLGEKMQAQTVSYGNLLPQIGALYDVLKITADETENTVTYKITVTGNQLDTLLAAASFGEALPVDGIQKLNLCLTEKDGNLEQISFFGNGDLDGTAIELDVTISCFRILASEDYPIPETVKQATSTVDPEELFRITEDLYRLLLALAPLADSSSLEGTLALTVDCGLIQLDTEMQLADLKTTSHSPLDLKKLHALPEILGWLCMEGDISCIPQGDAYVYTLELDEDSMQQLSRMILPELAQHGGNLTEGIVTILLEEKTVTSMEVSIEGKISALITHIPIVVNACFLFD